MAVIDERCFKLQINVTLYRTNAALGVNEYLSKTLVMFIDLGWHKFARSLFSLLSYLISWNGIITWLMFLYMIKWRLLRLWAQQKQIEEIFECQSLKIQNIWKLYIQLNSFLLLLFFLFLLLNIVVLFIVRIWIAQITKTLKQLLRKTIKKVVMNMKPTTQTARLITNLIAKRTATTTHTKAKAATAEQLNFYESACPHVQSANILANAAKANASIDYGTIRPYSEVPGPKPLPILGNTWR